MIIRDLWPSLPKKAPLHAQELAYDDLLSLNDFDDSVAAAVCLAGFFLLILPGFRLLAFRTYTPVALGLLFGVRQHKSGTHNKERGQG